MRLRAVAQKRYGQAAILWCSKLVLFLNQWNLRGQLNVSMSQVRRRPIWKKVAVFVPGNRY
jgi:hypothetical protein